MMNRVMVIVTAAMGWLAVATATGPEAVPLAPFRPPAIPLLTTDPYMQTWWVELELSVRRC